MRRHRNAHRIEMGEAISFEDVLTVITVLLLLRVLFMVPLVNVDKAKTVRAQADAYWPAHSQWIAQQPGDSLGLAPYATAFDLGESHAVISHRGVYQFIEALTPDSSVFILRHNPAESAYVSLRVQGHGHSKSFRRGRLLWSSAEQEWFTASDSVDYGEHPLSKALEKQQREFTRKERGY
jgi:hypothetical protein